MRISLPLLGQRDDLWKSKKLGTSSVTIGGYGCLLTCLAMIAKYYGKDTNPDKLNQDLVALTKNSNNAFGYKDKNLYIWGSLSKIYPDISETKNISTPDPLTTTQFNSIEKEIIAGRPVIAEVDFVPETSKEDMHFVVIMGKEGDDWIVSDPWWGDTSSITRYGKPEITIQRFIFTSGPMASQPIDKPTDDQKKALEILTAAFMGLPTDDELRKGNLEGYVRSITPEHLTYAEKDKRAKQFDAFIDKWFSEWHLAEQPNKSHQVVLEEEMGKFLDMEDSREVYKECAKKILALFLTPEAIDMLDDKEQAYKVEVDLVEGKINTLRGNLETCNDKLKNTKVVKTFKVGKYLIKVFLNTSKSK